MHPTRCAILAPSTGFFLHVRDNHLFDESIDFTVNLITLTVLTITTSYADKIVLNPGAGMWVKGRDELPSWITGCVSNFDAIENNSSEALILNWNDGNNSMSRFSKINRS